MSVSGDLSKSGSKSQNKQKLALEMLEDQREKRPNKIARDIIEYKAEKAKNIKEKLHRDRDRISVNPRKQPPREAAAAAAASAAEL